MNKLKTVIHLKTLTMVSMKTKVLSKDSFLEKLSQKLHRILRRVAGFLLRAQCATLVAKKALLG